MRRELNGHFCLNVVPLRCSEGAQAAARPPLIAEVRLDEGVGDPGLHGAQGSFKVFGLDAASFDVVLEGQEGGLPAYCGYLRQETDTDIQLSGAERRPAATARFLEARQIFFSLGGDLLFLTVLNKVTKGLRPPRWHR